MNEREKSQTEMEGMLQRFALTEPSAGQRQRALKAASQAWQEPSIQAHSSKLRFVRALAACIAVIVAVDVCGRVALAPWRAQLTLPAPSQESVDTEDFRQMVPSARLCVGTAPGLSPSRKTGLQDYRKYLDHLLDEPQTEQSRKQTPPNRHQGHYVPAGPASWHS